MCFSKLAELNPYVDVSWCEGSLLSEIASRDLSLVIVADGTIHSCCKVDALCKARGIKFIAASVSGVFSWSFCDFGEAHEVHDTNGEAVAEIKILSVTEFTGGMLIKTLEGEEHDLQEGDTVSLDPGSVEPPLLARVSRVVRSDQFVVQASGGGWKSFVKVKQSVVVSHASMQDSLALPEIVGSDFSKSPSSGSVFLGLVGVDEFREQHGGAYPRPWNMTDAEEVAKFAQARLPFCVQDSLFGRIETDLDVKLVHDVAFASAGMFHPLCAFLGGSVAQEAQKALSGKFLPQQQWALFDAREVLANRSPAFNAAALESKWPQTRADMLRVCCGDAVVDQLAATSLFVIGMGAIGCELLKNFAMLGLATAPTAMVHVTDYDCIEKSNLNRQFLFRPSDISQPKAVTAARVVGGMNTRMRVVASLDKVGPETEDKFSDAFFDSMDIVVNALDNVQARQYVDQRCVALGKPLLESGTLGTKGHVQVIVPFVTTSYSDNRDPPGKDIPFCTLRSFPSKIEHTLEWSKDMCFEKQFAQKPAELNKILLQRDSVVHTLMSHPQGPTFAKTVKRAIRMLKVEK
jgi:molybdopterin/thiamine biosynthesis adenylyltransferase